MAIALIASPGAVTGNGNQTCGSFTPTSNSVILVYGFIAPGTTAAPGITDSAGLTWTLWDTYMKDNNRTMRLWTAPVVTSPGAMTVTVTNSGNITYVAIQVWTGVNLV